MTLHCNKVKLIPCPEWVARMCMHKIIAYQSSPVEASVSYTQYGESSPQEALERYLIWIENKQFEDLGESCNFGYQERIRKVYKEHISEVKSIMNDSDLEVCLIKV